MEAGDASSLSAYILSKMLSGETRSSWRTLAAGHAFFTGTKSDGVLPLVLKATERMHGVKHHQRADRGKLEKILQYALETGKKEDLRLAIGATFSFGALLRVSETVSLRWQDVIVTGNDVRVDITAAKNDQLCEGRSSFFSMSPDSLGYQVFTRYRTIVPHHPHKPVFPNFRNGTHMSPDSFRRELKRVCREADVPILVPHSLRAGGATESLASGATIEETRHRGRWKSALSLDSYVPDSIASQGGTLSL